jgi:hypothetical protein
MDVKRVYAAFGRGEPEGRRPVGSPRRRWVDKIKMDLRGNRMWRLGLDSSGLG